MRTTYTGGVLDAFMDARHRPGLRGRRVRRRQRRLQLRRRPARAQHRVFVDQVATRVRRWGNVLRERSWFGMRFLFQTLPDELAPFDYETFEPRRGRS